MDFSDLPTAPGMITLPPTRKPDNTLSQPRRIRLKVGPPPGNFDIRVVVLNRSGRVIATALRWLRVSDMTGLGNHLEGLLAEKADHTKNPYLVAIDREGRVFYEDEFYRDGRLAYLGQAIHITHTEIFDPDNL